MLLAIFSLRRSSEVTAPPEQMLPATSRHASARHAVIFETRVYAPAEVACAQAAQRATLPPPLMTDTFSPVTPFFRRFAERYAILMRLFSQDYRFRRATPQLLLLLPSLSIFTRRHFHGRFSFPLLFSIREARESESGAMPCLQCS